jgi:uncharacterized protein YbjT (DUF2867 family)
MDGWQVRALTRDRSSRGAQALAGERIEVVEADMTDRSSLDRALAGAYGVFSVQNFYEAGPESEIAQGRAMIDAAVGAGVEHFVYASVCGSTLSTGIPQFETKGEIEAHLLESGLPATILQPVFFMDNMTWVFAPTSNGDGGLNVSLALDPDAGVPMVATEDIGALAAAIFADPETWVGRTLEVAGELVTPTSCAATVARITGKPTQFVEIPLEGLRAYDEGFARLFEWLNGHRYTIDIEAARTLHPGLLTLEEYLLGVGWSESSEFAAPTATGSG